MRRRWRSRPPDRIAVIGRAGSGKTTYALMLGRALGLPVVHLDALYWTADWNEAPRESFDETQRFAIERDRWVIDGGYLASRGWPARMERAQVIVIAEAPLVICLWRVVRRALDRRSTRPDRPPGGGEQLSLYFLWWTVTWRWRHRHLADQIRAAGHPVVVARSEGDMPATSLVAGCVSAS